MSCSATTIGTNPRFWTPRSVYTHVPFCRHRCGYCNFTLIAGRDELIDQYLRAIEVELSAIEPGHEIDTLFFGGGTPSHLAPKKLTQLIEIVRQRFALVAGAEFSIEANPLDIDDARVAALVEGGVTRVSLGVQSFADSKLTILERDHRAADVQIAVEKLNSRVSAVSLDLIFGTPGETLSSWEEDLRRAIELEPHHVSVYGLTWEQGTSFWSRRSKGELTGCDEGLERDMYELAIDRLTGAGFDHYEVSNFARPGFRCRHNEAYWLGRTYFAAGPGAARYVAGRREMNHRSTTTYLRRVLRGESPVVESEMLSPEESARERLVFGLRRLEGVDRRTFYDETGFEVERLGGRKLEQFIEMNLLEREGGRLRLTPRGLFVSDSLWPDLLVP